MVLGRLPEFNDDKLIVGIETSDDAAVYKITDDLAMIQTVDFFPPVVDDPYVFGQIAAANALSDVYAMGGQPKVALNVVGFPNCLSPDILSEILRGGADKVREAGAVLVGGHSVNDEEPKYGLCVSGFVHPEKLYKNDGCVPGDALVLTKQIGSGIINTAIKSDCAPEAAVKEVIQVMSALNKKAKEASEGVTVHACTDVTGFGLLGHAAEMAFASDVSFEIRASKVAYIEGAAECAKKGMLTGGARKNLEYWGKHIKAGGIDKVYLDLLSDPQTSGGLLFSIPKECLEDFLKALKDKKTETKISVIGCVTEKKDCLITVKM